MAYTTISDSLIQVGEPTKREIFTTIKDNEDDLDSRVSSIESASRIDVFNYNIDGYLEDYSTDQLAEIDIYKTTSALSLTEAKMTLIDASSSSGGTLELDIQASTDGISYNSIFTVNPTITSNSTGDTSGSFTINPSYASLAIGTYLKLGLSSIKSPQGGLHVEIYGEPT